MRAKYYYLVWVRSIQYKGGEALTYTSDTEFEIGSIVVIPLRKEQSLGIITQRTSAPNFATKPIIRSFDLPSIPPAVLELGTWLKGYYPASIGVITSLLLPSTFSKRLTDDVIAAQSDTNIGRIQKIPLTDDQRHALTTMRDTDTYLLHGRTGSGKTRIYIELAKRSLDDGRSVVILSPEIGLTAQLSSVFAESFGHKVVILHSRLTPKERQASWLRILTATKPIIVIGPRSALFAPLSNIGLIVIDEAHDLAYKQEQAPHYQAVRVASQLSNIHNATLILGTATPSVTDYYLAQHKNKHIIRLNKSARPNKFKTSLTVVDIKDRSLFARSTHLSLPLIQSIADSLMGGEQALLYLNRRGTARVALCEHCGWQAQCPHCDVALTYHGDRHKLRCHVCGFNEAAPLACPSCQHPSLSFRSFGTKAIVDEVQKIFPEARVIRIDADNIKAERFESQYSQIIQGNVDIIVGTQMVAKGLDLPKLSTLGIVLADSSLYTPDYTAQERTYQLISQVIGRIGRGHTYGSAIIQTFRPESPLLQSALLDDWDTYYKQELDERRKYSYPPFCYLLKLTVSRATSLSAEKAAQDFRNVLVNGNARRITIDGPAPAFHEKISGKYRWQLVVKSSYRSALIRIISLLPKSGWSYDIDPADLL